MGRNGKDKLRVHLGCGFRMHCHHVERAVGKGARLIEYHRFRMGKRFQVVAALHQDAQARSPADAAEERKRHTDNQGTRAGNNQEGKAALHPIGPALPQQKRRQHGQQQGADGYHRGVVACEARDEVLGLGLLLAGVFHQLQDARNRGLLEGLGNLHGKQAGHVHTAGYDLGAFLDVARHRFTGKRRRVELA